MSVRLLLADDHKIVRDGLRLLLDRTEEFEVVGEANTGREAVHLAETLQPDIIIMDVAMPDLNGIDATQQITDRNPHIKIIALTMHTDRLYLTGMIKAGACGFILKESTYDELFDAIQTVLHTGTYISPRFTNMILEDYRRKSGESPEREDINLSGREREVLQLIAEEKTSKDIAALLNVSLKTVETHRQNIMQKLDIHSIAGLTRYAIKFGLTKLEG